MKKILVFGTGLKYKRKRRFFQEISDLIEIVAFVDNNVELQGQLVDGKKVIAADEISDYEYDGIYITTEKYYEEIKEQLLSLSINEDAIWSMFEIKNVGLRGKSKDYIYDSEWKVTDYKARVLILTTDMYVSGGINVAIYLAKALKEQGYYVEMTAPDIDDAILSDLEEARINYCKHYSLPYLYEEDIEWLNVFDLVIVNVFQMINCAEFISRIKPVIWWIHEDRSWPVYINTQKQFCELHDNNTWMNMVDVIGVSTIAQEAFNYFYPNTIKGIMPFGIPDEKDKYQQESNTIKSDIEVCELRLLVIGSFSRRKGHDILISAIESLPDKYRNKIELWFVGPEDANTEELSGLISNLSHVKYWGKLPHDKTMEVVALADAVVCPSRVETMSMTIVEGMMMEKICITTDGTGVANYITNGENGFVVEAENVEDLANTIRFVYDKKDSMDSIRHNARRTYEENFSMSEFGRKADKIIQKDLSVYMNN